MIETLSVQHVGCLSKGTGRAEVRTGWKRRRREARNRGICWNESTTIEAQNADSGIADILVTFGKTVHIAPSIRRSRCRTEVFISIFKITFLLTRIPLYAEVNFIVGCFEVTFFLWRSSMSSLIDRSENCKTPQAQSLSFWLSLPASLSLPSLHVHPSGGASMERGGPDDCPHKLCVSQGAKGLSEQ